MFSASTFNQVGSAVGPVLGAVLARVPASVAVDFEAVQLSSLLFPSSRRSTCSFCPSGWGFSNTRP